MTDAEFWRQVGRMLAAARDDRGWNWTNVYKDPDGTVRGPHNSNVKEQEEGLIANVSTLENQAYRLGFTVVDLFRAVLAESPEQWSPTARRIATLVDEISPTKRQALREIAESLGSPPSRGE